MNPSTTPRIPSCVAPLRVLIDERLAAYTAFDRGCPDKLQEAIQYVLLAPGKRLRPVLVLLATQASGGHVEAALPVACAVEMIHAYSLVHDDLPAMDDDDLRRGRPTCHRQFDEATAILVGDALIPLAFEVMARDVQPPARAARCCWELARAAGATQLVGGQVDDLSSGLDAADPERLESIHLRKTAALIGVSLKLGALVAGAPDDWIEHFEDSGKKLGLAFQISDDLLDISGDPVTMGKSVRKDHERGRVTYPTLLGAQASQQRVEQLIAEAMSCWHPLGAAAQPLREIAEYLVQRTH